MSGKCSQAAMMECDWQHVVLLLSRMERELLKPEVVTFSTAISSCGSCDRWREALELFERCDADVIAFNAAISACEKGGWEVAFHLLNLLKLRSLRENLTTYNSILSVCGRSREWQRALELFSSLQLRDVISYNACITACGQVSQWQHALFLMSELGAQGAADVVTCSASIDAFSNASLWQLALLTFFQAPVRKNVLSSA